MRDFVNESDSRRSGRIFLRIVVAAALLGASFTTVLSLAHPAFVNVADLRKHIPSLNTASLQWIIDSTSRESDHSRDFSRVKRATTRKSKTIAKKATPPPPAPKRVFYSAIVAFGDSYTDNGHARPAALNPTYQPNYKSYGKGRSTNGPVQVEYMALATSAYPLTPQKSPVKLLDFALGGTFVDNTLTPYNQMPDAGLQVQQYLSDLATGNATLGSQRVLHFYAAGINSMYQIVMQAFNAGINETSIANAQSRVSAHTQAIARQLTGLESNAILNNKTSQADFLLIGLPSLQYNPFFYQSLGNGNQAGLDLLILLSKNWNSQLLEFTNSFRQPVGAKGGKVFFGDFSSLWSNMANNPRAFFASPPSFIYQPCWLNDANVCSDAGNYLMWDTLHPTTAAHKSWLLLGIN